MCWAGDVGHVFNVPDKVKTGERGGVSPPVHWLPDRGPDAAPLA